MKMKKLKKKPLDYYWIWLVGVLPLVISSCNPIGATLTPPTSPQSSVSSQSPLLEPPGLTATPQGNKEPTITPTASPLITATPVLPSPTLTLSPLSVLTTDGAMKRISELLATNGKCRLPCFWGLTPGDTSGENAQTFMMPFTSSARRYTLNSERGSMFWVQETENLEVNITIGYDLDTTGIIERIYFHAEAHDISQGQDQSRRTYDNPTFNQEFQAYMLPQILSNYGPPEEVFILTSSEVPVPNPWWPFYVFLLYPTQGIFIDYEVGLDTVGDHVIGCPTHAHMTLWLLAPGNEDYPEVLGGNWDPFFENPAYYKTIEEAASMTVEEFYETFKNPENTTCLETPADLWADPSQ